MKKRRKERDLVHRIRAVIYLPPTFHFTLPLMLICLHHLHKNEKNRILDHVLDPLRRRRPDRIRVLDMSMPHQVRETHLARLGVHILPSLTWPPNYPPHQAQVRRRTRAITLGI
jgi:hypothetical protein